MSQVMIIRGKDRGETSTIKRVIRSQNRVIVEGKNLAFLNDQSVVAVKKHQYLFFDTLFKLIKEFECEIEEEQGSKGLTKNDPVLNFGREKSSYSKTKRSYVDEPYNERDPFTANLVGLVERKKEVVRQTDFHYPVRESFEVELEREQKMQEMERQRVVEEQEIALEQARREDE
ncbi:chitinase-like protein [Tanacetum coccineum]